MDKIRKGSVSIKEDSVSFDVKTTDLLAGAILPKMEDDYQSKADRNNLDDPEDVAEVTNYIAGATVHGNSNLADHLHKVLASEKGMVDPNKKAQSSFSGKRLKGVKWRGRDIYFAGHFGKRKTISFFVKGNL